MLEKPIFHPFALEDRGFNTLLEEQRGDVRGDDYGDPIFSSPEFVPLEDLLRSKRLAVENPDLEFQLRAFYGSLRSEAFRLYGLDSFDLVRLSPSDLNALCIRIIDEVDFSREGVLFSYLFGQGCGVLLVLFAVLTPLLSVSFLFIVCVELFLISFFLYFSARVFQCVRSPLFFQYAALRKLLGESFFDHQRFVVGE